MTEPPITAEQRARLLKIATYASVGTALLLVGAKGAAWLITGSVSILASLIDSLMDTATSLINLLAVRYALAPADAEHRFGHGKAESLAGIAQAMFIAVSAIFLLLQAGERLLHPAPLKEISSGIGVMVFAMACTAILVAIQRYVIKRTQSAAIRADSLHFVTDFLTNGGTLLALFLTSSGWSNADPVLAIIIGLYILYSAKGIGVQAFDLLMDRELPDEQRTRIEEIARSHSAVHGVHDLRTRQSGQTIMIQLHIELDGDMPLHQAHAISDEVESAISQQFTSADVIIHQDPIRTDSVKHADQAYLHTHR